MKKLLNLFLSAILVCGFLPATALARPAETQVPQKDIQTLSETDVEDGQSQHLAPLAEEEFRALEDVEEVTYFAVLYDTDTLVYQRTDTANPLHGNLVKAWAFSSNSYFYDDPAPWWQEWELTEQVRKVCFDGVVKPKNILGLFSFRNLESVDLTGLDTSAVTSFYGVFGNLDKLETVDLSMLDASKVTSAEEMFSACTNLTSVLLPAGGMPKAQSFRSMFGSCGSLASIDLSPLSTSRAIDLSGMFAYCQSLEYVDLSPINISSATTMDYFLGGCSNLQSFTRPSGTSRRLIDAQGLFSGCRLLTSIDISWLRKASLENISYMFGDCESLREIDLSPLLTANATDMSRMFSGCRSLEHIDLSPLITSNVTDMSYMFAACDSLIGIDLSSLDTSSVVTMESMFSGCSALESIDLSVLDTSQVTTMEGMLSGCTSLTSVNAAMDYCPKLITINGMFSDCTGLEAIDLTGFDTSNVERMMNLFKGCENITSFDLSGLDTHNVHAMGFMFQDCISVETLDLTSFDDSNVHCMCDMFFHCSKLRVVDISSFTFDSFPSRGYCTYSHVDYPELPFHWTSSLETVFVSSSIDKVSLYNLCEVGTLSSKFVYVDGFQHQSSAGAARQTTTQRMTVYENAAPFSEPEWKFYVSPGANITAQGATVSTNSKGTAIVERGNSDVVVSKGGYITRTLSAERAAASSMVRLQKPSTKNPVISGVWIDTTDVLYDELSIYRLTDKTAHFDVEIDWGTSSKGTLRLVQNQHIATFNGNTLDIVLSDKFDTAKPIYIQAIDGDGRKVSKKLNITNNTNDLVSSRIDGMGVDFGDGLKVKFPNNMNPSWLAGQELELKLGTGIPLSISAENGIVRVAIGADFLSHSSSSTWAYDGKTRNKTTKNETENFVDKVKDVINTDDVDKATEGLKNLKESYHNVLSKSPGKMGWDADVSVVGFAEGTYDENGNVTWTDGGMIVEPSVSFGASWAFAIGPVPMFLEAKIVGEILGQMNIFRSAQVEKITPAGSLTGTIKLSGGVGLGLHKIISVSGGAVGKLQSYSELNTFKLADSSNYFKLTGSINFYAKATLAFMEYQYDFDPIVEKTLAEVPNYGIETNSLTALEDSNIYDLSAYRVKDLSYLDGGAANGNSLQTLATSENGNSSLQTTQLKSNIYRESAIQYAAVGSGGRLAVWQDGASSDVNGIQLYWSYFDGSSWTAPALVCDDGTMDMAPSLCSIDGDTLLVWQDATTAFDAQTATLDDIAGSFDISYASFTPETGFSQKTTIIREGLDCMPVARVPHGEGSIYWVGNDGDWLGTSGSNTIYCVDITDEGASEIQECVTSATAITALAANQFWSEVAYTVDGDNNLSTDNDITLRELDGTVISYGQLYDPSFHDGYLYWRDGSRLTGSHYEIEGPFPGASYQLANYNGQTFALYPQNDDDYSFKLMACTVAEDGTWSAPIEVYSSEGKAVTAYAAISNQELIPMSDDFPGLPIEALVCAASVVENADSPFQQTDLLAISYNTDDSVSIEGVYWNDDDYVPGGEMPFVIELMNSGLTPAFWPTVEIVDESGVILASQETSYLSSGSRYTTDVVVPLGQNLQPQNFTINVLNYDGEIIASESCHMDYQDVIVSNVTWGVSEEGNLFVCADVSNVGYSATSESVVATLHRGSADGEILGSVDLGVLASEELAVASFVVGSTAQDERFYVTVNATEPDHIGNDVDFTVVDRYQSRDARLSALSLSGVTASFADFENIDSPYEEEAQQYPAYAWTTIDDTLVSNNAGESNTASYTDVVFASDQAFNVSFNWSVASEDGCDGLTVLLDNEPLVDFASGKTSGWCSTLVEAGKHTLTLSYWKDVDFDLHRDQAVISNLIAAVPCVEHTPELMPAVEATCRSDGRSEYTWCATCGSLLSERTIIPSDTAHRFVEDVCEICGTQIDYYLALYEGVVPGNGLHEVIQRTDQAVPEYGSFVYGCWAMGGNDEDRDVFAQYVDRITYASIHEEIFPQFIGGIFSYCPNLVDIDLSNLNAKNLESANGLLAFDTSLKAVDLSFFSTASDLASIDMNCAFEGCSALETIYCGEAFDVANADWIWMFEGCTSLVGGNGTAYDDEHPGLDYAHVDTSDAPGYFTAQPELGDINGNGHVNIVDAQIAYDIAVKNITWGLPQYSIYKNRCYINDDDVIDAADAFAIQRAVHYGWPTAR